MIDHACGECRYAERDASRPMYRLECTHPRAVEMVEGQRPAWWQRISFHRCGRLGEWFEAAKCSQQQ